MDSDGIQIIVESLFASFGLLAFAIFIVLKMRDTFYPQNRINLYNWGQYQNASLDQHQSDSTKARHA